MTDVGDNNSPSGGVKIPQAVRDQTQNRILAYAKKHYSRKYTRMAYIERRRNTPLIMRRHRIILKLLMVFLLKIETGPDEIIAYSIEKQTPTQKAFYDWLRNRYLPILIKNRF
jgi:hypothetical protein